MVRKTKIYDHFSSSCGRIINILSFFKAIRQAISKALVAYYQKCRFIILEEKKKRGRETRTRKKSKKKNP
jgi:hypothetical protein